eukprot:CAMPEP_0116922016 /NCGR_PEP_ID=MMETSP0467-20121206/21994_1 /TAXON_ID=283647 /ORGANISM="Mesodinium pulex, Strain SPMC105" /LENGTH=59 /DNA_ID=CAMNT_0004600233 /DNA_START=19 /DNA_END=195 /DNA_ORIENTATION=+
MFTPTMFARRREGRHARPSVTITSRSSRDPSAVAPQRGGCSAKRRSDISDAPQGSGIGA